MHTMVMLAVVLIMFESVRHSILRLAIEIDRNPSHKIDKFIQIFMTWIRVGNLQQKQNKKVIIYKSNNQMDL